MDRAEGRRALLGWATAVGGYLGFGAALLADVDFQQGLGIVTGSAVGAGLATFLLIRNRTVTRADGEAAIFGGSTLMGNVAVFLGLELVDNQFESDQEARGALGAVLGLEAAGAALGAAGGYLLSRHHNATLAQTRMVAMGSSVGLVHAIAGFFFVPPDDLGLSFRRAAQLSVVAADLGAVGGYYLASKLRWSHSRFNFIQVGIGAGATLGYIAALAKTGPYPSALADRRVLAAGVLGGMYLGGGLAWLLSRNKAPAARLGGKARATRSVLLTPAVVRGRPGLSLAGQF